MTQLIKSTPPTLFPSELFTHILGYCDDTIEDKQKNQMKKVINDFKLISKSRKELGIGNKTSTEDWNKIEDLFEGYYSDVLFGIHHIITTVCEFTWGMKEVKEVYTCTKVNDNCTINSYTKTGTDSFDLTLTYSQCTNY
tara:strand:+ start:169 stop:585 length:417 start_codon:yes stop_codon:yes gene_type:complete